MLLAGNEGIRVRFYWSPFFCFKFIVLKCFLFLPPSPYICHSFYFESLCFLCPFPILTNEFMILCVKSHSSLILCAFLSFFCRISSFIFTQFFQSWQYFQTSILKWGLLIYCNNFSQKCCCWPVVSQRWWKLLTQSQFFLSRLILVCSSEHFYFLFPKISR